MIIKFKQSRFIIPVFLLVAVFAAGIWYSYTQKQTDPISVSDFKLNTVIQISIYDSKDETLLTQALELCDQYENVFSRTEPDSELYKLNHRTLPQKDNVYQVSEELLTVIERGLFYSRLSDGAFDITIAPVSSLWDFTSGTCILPDEKKLQEAVKQVGWEKVRVTEEGVAFADDTTQLDLGGIAKGYIADQIKEYLVSQGVESAVINLGGNVLCIGGKKDRTDFQVGIQKPFADRNETAGVISVNDRSVVSSGIYERGFQIEDTWYHHILNPSTGYPYQNNLVSVTIVSDASVDGDALSTICFSLGLEKGMELINSMDGVSALFITKDYQLHPSADFPALSVS